MKADLAASGSALGVGFGFGASGSRRASPIRNGRGECRADVRSDAASEVTLVSQTPAPKNIFKKSMSQSQSSEKRPKLPRWEPKWEARAVALSHIR
ncbi:hypothetical protein PWT90_00190 [Aphanocladium album]|nr:hypothetical protein PWT90_00190 [Aphanocladium album]